MESILTASCKMQTSLEQVAKIEATLRELATACNWIDRSVDILSYQGKDQMVSLTLIGERKIFKLLLGNYQIGKLKSKKQTSATSIENPKGEYFINTQVKEEAPTSIGAKNLLGVDLEKPDV